MVTRGDRTQLPRGSVGRKGVSRAPVQRGTTSSSCRQLVAPSCLSQWQTAPWAPEDVLPVPCLLHRGTGQGTAEGRDPHSRNANRVLGLHRHSRLPGRSPKPLGLTEPSWQCPHGQQLPAGCPPATHDTAGSTRGPTTTLSGEVRFGQALAPVQVQRGGSLHLLCAHPGGYGLTGFPPAAYGHPRQIPRNP